MARQKQTSGYGDRLIEALERGPLPMSVRALAKKVAEAHPNVRGTSYGGVRQYATDGVRNPRVDLLRAFADVLKVRADWLAFGEGLMTEEEELSENIAGPERAALEADMLSNVESSVHAALSGELPRLTSGLVRPRTRLIELIQQVTSRMAFLNRHTDIFSRGALDSQGRARVGRLYALEGALKEAAVREIARAVRGPADALSVNLDDLSEDHFALYVDAISTAIAVLLMNPRDTRREAPNV